MAPCSSHGPTTPILITSNGIQIAMPGALPVITANTHIHLGVTNNLDNSPMFTIHVGYLDLDYPQEPELLTEGELITIKDALLDLRDEIRRRGPALWDNGAERAWIEFYVGAVQQRLNLHVRAQATNHEQEELPDLLLMLSIEDGDEAMERLEEMMAYCGLDG